MFTAMLLDPGPTHSRPGSLLTPDGIVIHSTATPEADAPHIRNFFNVPKTTGQASSHFVADWVDVFVLIPAWPGACEVAWHAGHTANGRFLGLEWCETADQAKFQKSYVNLVEAVQTLLAVWGWPPDDAHVWSHQKVSMTWHETTHTDPMPYLSRWGKTWANLMADLLKGVV